eukprot:jgi/Picre1/31941/NNA_007289.t1
MAGFRLGFLHMLQVTGAELESQVFEQILARELNAHVNILGKISDSKLHLKRSYLDPAHKRAALTLQRWMKEACLTTWIDSVGNVRGRVAGANKGPALLIGSHYDTVIDGGIYDGALGILVGIAAVKAAVLESAVQDDIISGEALSAMVGEDDIDCDSIYSRFGNGKVPLLSRPIEVVAFCDEEGVRFQSTFLGSKALSGTLTEDVLTGTFDKDGISILEAILGDALATSAEDIIRRPGSDEYSGYLEVHLEQGPILELEGKPLGVVSGISGQSRYQLSIWGEQGHAGTVPMKLRKDPMPASATLIHSLETLCRGVAINMSYLKTLDASIIPREDILRLEEDGSLVCTVGSLQTWPGASNVIPQNVNFTLDIRSLSDSSRNNIVRIIESIMEGECAKRELMCRLKKKHEASSVTMDEILTEKLINSVKMAEYDGKKEASTNTCSNIEVVRIASGAGHDALAVSSIMPVSMLFVRSRNGISHSPDEWVDPEDIRASSITTFYFIRDWEKGPW